ncbi:MAG: YciI family protein [Cyclobacteriaceae bacterium]|nr:YciI family protein [Cyclobacteriaceae bacterium]
MKDFMLIFRNSMREQENFVNQSPEEMDKEMQLWQKWMEKLGANGSGGEGNPLLPEGKVIRGTKHFVTDGPFIEGKDLVGGYMIIKAKDLEHATQLSLDCPHLAFEDSTVEVREIIAIG